MSSQQRIGTGSQTHLHIHKPVYSQSDEPTYIRANACEPHECAHPVFSNSWSATDIVPKKISTHDGRSDVLAKHVKRDVVEKSGSSDLRFNGARGGHTVSPGSPKHLRLDFFVKSGVGSDSDELLVFTCVPVMNWSREICAPALSYTSGVNEKVPIEHKTTVSLHFQLVLAKCRRRLILRSSAVIVKAVFSLTSFTPLPTACFYPPKLVRIVLAKTESFDYSLSGCGSWPRFQSPRVLH